MPVKNMDGVALYNEKQNEIVRQCLRDALVILMKQKKYDTISISELCRKAGVSRSGFYNNFSALADVFKEIARTFIQEITEKMLRSKIITVSNGMNASLNLSNCMQTIIV